MKRNTIILLIVALLGGAYFWAFSTDNEATVSNNNAAPIVLVKIPSSLSSKAQLGQTKFEENCAACHGQNAAGQEGVAPPLVHKIYEPSHHGDESFQRAAALGVRAHHWPFGNMPPVEGLNRSEISDIIAYVRELQRANGIF